MVVIGAEEQPARRRCGKKPGELANSKTFTFTWDKASFPGTIIAGTFQEFKSDDAGIDLHVFFKPNRQNWKRNMRRRQ